MIAGIGVGNAAAARRYAIESPLVEGLKENEKGTRTRDLLHID
jgi:hypothetical protein